MKSPRIWIPLLVLAIGCTGSLTARAQGTADSSGAANSGAAAGKAAPHHATKAAPKHREMIDINSASKEDLMKLPGIGEKTAEKIIDGRPYTSKVQLRSKKIVTRAEYAKISARITAKAAAAEK